MALRLIEAYIPQVSWETVQETLADKPLLSAWHEESDKGYLHLRILIAYEESSPLLDVLEKRFSHIEGFQMIVLPVEASIPRPEENAGRWRCCGKERATAASMLACSLTSAALRVSRRGSSPG